MVFLVIWSPHRYGEGARIDLVVLFYMDSLTKTGSLSYIKVHEAKKALIKDISPFDSPGQHRKHLYLVYRVIMQPSIETM